LQFIDERIAEKQERLDTERLQHVAVCRGLRRDAARRYGSAPRAEAEIDDFLAKDSRFTKAQRRIAELGEQIDANAVRKARLHELQHTAERPFFLWHFFFQDVFAQGGFDIVIANPPYVRADHPSQVHQRAAILATDKFKTLWEKWDLFVAFIEQSFHLLKPGGVMAQIVSDGYCHAKYAQKSQNWFLQNSRVVRLDFVGSLKLFDAGVRNIIFFVEKADGTRWRPERRLHLERPGRLPEEPMIGHVRLLPTDEQKNLTHRTFFPEDAVAKSFSAATLPLESLCYISVGMVINADEKLAKGAFLTGDLISPIQDQLHPKAFVEGKNLTKWFFSENSWLEWGTSRAPHQFRRQTFPELYEHPEKLMLPMVGAVRGAIDTEQFYCNHGIFVGVPWHQLEGVRNTSLKKAARCVGEKPPRPDLPQRESLESNSRRFTVKFLLGVINSTCARDFLLTNRRNNVQLYPDDWKQLPIPDVTPEQQAPIVALVEKILTAKRAKPDADVSILEAEVDRLVTALYGIGSDQGAPPFRVERTTADAKTILRDHILAELGRRNPYISLDAIRAELTARRLEVETDTLQRYLHEFVAAGFIHDAGRGWYSTLAQRLVLDRAHIAPVVTLIEQAFPLLTFAVWSTQQINPWMHHLLGKFVTFVYVEKDTVGAVWELLKEKGYDAHRDPTKKEATKNFAVHDNTIVIRAGGISQAPVDGHYATPEKLLVDLVAEADALPLIERAELDGVFSGAIGSGRIDMPVLLKYSSRKRLNEYILNLVSPVLSQNDVL
jgi:hypothetical protein